MRHRKIELKGGSESREAFFFGPQSMALFRDGGDLTYWGSRKVEGGLSCGMAVILSYPKTHPKGWSGCLLHPQGDGRGPAMGWDGDEDSLDWGPAGHICRKGLSWGQSHGEDGRGHKALQGRAPLLWGRTARRLNLLGHGTGMLLWGCPLTGDMKGTSFRGR